MPEQLQVFAALITATGPGRQQSWRDTQNTITVAYLPPTGAAKRTGLSVPAAVQALQALERAGLALPSSENRSATAGGSTPTCSPKQPPA
jgi:hypothetical protein